MTRSAAAVIPWGVPWDLRRLLRKHRWTTREGCKTIVLNHGAVQFDYPRSWAVSAGADSVSLYEHPPRKGNRLEVSCLYFPPVDWSELPVADLLDDVTTLERERVTPGPLREEIRRGIELAWRDLTVFPRRRWLAHRAICVRVCMARYGNAHCLLTYEFRRKDRARCEEAWENVLDTLVLDREIADPAAGPWEATL